MKKMIYAFIATILVSFTAHAVSPDKVDFSRINLNSMRLLDDSNQDSFGYKIKLLTNPSAEIVQTLQNEAGVKIISPIYQLNERSAFKNIYVFIGINPDGEYQFDYVLHNSKGGMFTVGMTILNVEKNRIDIVHGPSDQLSKYTLISTSGDLFP